MCPVSTKRWKNHFNHLTLQPDNQDKIFIHISFLSGSVYLVSVYVEFIFAQVKKNPIPFDSKNRTHQQKTTGFKRNLCDVSFNDGNVHTLTYPHWQ